MKDRMYDKLSYSSVEKLEKQIMIKDAQIATLRSLLKKSEWGNEMGDEHCWCCGTYRESIHGHAPDCELAAALKEE